MIAKLKPLSEAIQKALKKKQNNLEAIGLSASEESVVAEEVIEKVGDIGILIGQMIKMGLPEILDNHIPRHWKQQGLSWGWTTVIWLAYVISESDHRKLPVEEYVAGAQNMLSGLIGQEVNSKDFTDDRLAIVSKHLSNPNYWKEIEKELNDKTIKVYDLEAKIVQLDATSSAGNHQVIPGGLIQFGHHKDGTIKPQFKIMIAGLDPLGMPLATEVVSGEQADDGLYVPIIKLVDESLNKTGLLYVGDCKMSAFDTRAYIVSQENHYLSPLPLTGETAKDMETWIEEGIAKGSNQELEVVYKQEDDGSNVLIASGYEFEREHVDGKEVKWTERVLVIKSVAHASSQAKKLEKRLDTAIEEIKALTPERGRGKRQITDEEQLTAAIDKVLKEQRIGAELLDIDYEKQVEKQTKYVGKGRGSKNRAKSVTKRVRFSINSVTKNIDAIDRAKERLGWKAFVTSSSFDKMSLSEAVINYRHEYRIERIFNRMKSRLKLEPWFVKRKEQITGMIHLLSLGVRVLTLIEYVVRSSLKDDEATLPDLHQENRRKKTNKPTAERLLSAFSNIFLHIIKIDHREVYRSLTPLSELQTEILNRLGLDASIYLKLEIIKS